MKYTYKVQRLKPLSDRVTELLLEPIHQALAYTAGQYVLLYAKDEAKPFSIANAPLGGSTLEFHIRHAPHNEFIKSLMQSIREKGQVLMEGPYGHCTLQPHARSMIFLAGGTGFAPMKALIEEALASEVIEHMHLFWCARTSSDLYLHDLPLHWQQCVPHFSYTPIIEHPLHNDMLANNYEVKSIIDTLLRHYPNFADKIVYAAGHPEMIEKVFTALQKYGLTIEHLFSDTPPSLAS